MPSVLISNQRLELEANELQLWFSMTNVQLNERRRKRGLNKSELELEAKLKDFRERLNRVGTFC